MKTDIYILLFTSFFKVKDVEYACTPGHNNISLFSTIEKALEEKNKRAEILKAMKYHVTGSGPDYDDPFICYWSRYENDKDKAIVFTIMRKNVEGELFQYG